MDRHFIFTRSQCFYTPCLYVLKGKYTRNPQHIINEICWSHTVWTHLEKVLKILIKDLGHIVLKKQTYHPVRNALFLLEISYKSADKYFQKGIFLFESEKEERQELCFPSLSLSHCVKGQKENGRDMASSYLYFWMILNNQE